MIQHEWGVEVWQDYRNYVGRRSLKVSMKFLNVQDGVRNRRAMIENGWKLMVMIQVEVCCIHYGLYRWSSLII